MGKTLIAANLARMVSQSVKVLLIDLDLYNRGSTALLLEQGVSAATDSTYSLLRKAVGPGSSAGPEQPLETLTAPKSRRQPNKPRSKKWRRTFTFCPVAPPAR